MQHFFVEFFFFKQKTAYEILSGLVGSEMCIRDSIYSALRGFLRVLRFPLSLKTKVWLDCVNY